MARPAEHVLIDRARLDVGEVVALDGSAYHALLRDAPADGITGGQIYAAVIAACAGTATLLTFNERLFLPHATSGMEIVVPDQEGR